MVLFHTHLFIFYFCLAQVLNILSFSSLLPLPLTLGRYSAQSLKKSFSDFTIIFIFFKVISFPDLILLIWCELVKNQFIFVLFHFVVAAGALYSLFLFQGGAVGCCFHLPAMIACSEPHPLVSFQSVHPKEVTGDIVVAVTEPSGKMPRSWLQSFAFPLFNRCASAIQAAVDRSMFYPLYKGELHPIPGSIPCFA